MNPLKYFFNIKLFNICIVQLKKITKKLCNSKKKMDIIRMGDTADSENLALSDFVKTLWTKISAFLSVKITF